jgi:hypothetical protein
MSRQFLHDPHSPDGRMPSFDAYVERAAASSPSGPSRYARCHSPITPAHVIIVVEVATLVRMDVRFHHAFPVVRLGPPAPECCVDAAA